MCVGLFLPGFLTNLPQTGYHHKERNKQPRTHTHNRDTHIFPQQLKALGSQPRYPELRFDEGFTRVTRVPPGFYQGSTRVPRGFHEVLRGLRGGASTKRGLHAVGGYHLSLFFFCPGSTTSSQQVLGSPPASLKRSTVHMAHVPGCPWSIDPSGRGEQPGAAPANPQAPGVQQLHRRREVHGV